MQLTAYNPATRKFSNQHLEIKEAANLVAGVAVKDIENKKVVITNLKAYIRQNLSNLRGYRRRLKAEEDILEQLKNSDPKKSFLKIFKQAMKKSWHSRWA